MITKRVELIYNMKPELERAESSDEECVAEIGCNLTGKRL
jgi:hypothetical protein